MKRYDLVNDRAGFRLLITINYFITDVPENSTTQHSITKDQYSVENKPQYNSLESNSRAEMVSYSEVSTQASVGA